MEPKNNLLVIKEGLFVTENCIGFWFCVLGRFFSFKQEITGQVSQPCVTQAIWSDWQLHNIPILFSMGQNNMQAHRLKKDNARTRIKPLTLDYS